MDIDVDVDIRVYEDTVKIQICMYMYTQMHLYILLTVHMQQVKLPTEESATDTRGSLAGAQRPPLRNGWGFRASGSLFRSLGC